MAPPRHGNAPVALPATPDRDSRYDSMPRMSRRRSARRRSRRRAAGTAIFPPDRPYRSSPPKAAEY